MSTPNQPSAAAGDPEGISETGFTVQVIQSWSVPDDPETWAPRLDRVQLANAHGNLVRWFARLFPDLSRSGDANGAPPEFMGQIAKCICYLAEREVPIALKPVASTLALTPKRNERRHALAMHHIVTCAAGREQPRLTEAIVSAYAKNGYIQMQGPVMWGDESKGWCAVETAIRNVSSGAAVALIKAGGTIDNIPAAPIYMNQDLKMGQLVAAGDIIGLARFLMLNSQHAESVAQAICERRQRDMKQVIEARIVQIEPPSTEHAPAAQQQGRRRIGL